MGEFLSQPIKDKQSEDGDGTSVRILLTLFRSGMVLAVCKDGVKEWKTLIFLT